MSCDDGRPVKVDDQYESPEFVAAIVNMNSKCAEQFRFTLVRYPPDRKYEILPESRLDDNQFLAQPNMIEVNS